MKRKISSTQKDFVAKRASYRCEYCRLPALDAIIQFHIEHIKSIKHGGSNDLDNLAYSCPDCNFYKGTDLGTYLNENEIFIRFFNPRVDHWLDHFKILDGVLYSNTEIAEATIQIFQMNKTDRVELRRMLAENEFLP